MFQEVFVDIKTKLDTFFILLEAEEVASRFYEACCTGLGLDLKEQAYFKKEFAFASLRYKFESGNIKSIGTICALNLLSSICHSEFKQLVKLNEIPEYRLLLIKAAGLNLAQTYFDASRCSSETISQRVDLVMNAVALQEMTLEKNR